MPGAQLRGVATLLSHPQILPQAMKVCQWLLRMWWEWDQQDHVQHKPSVSWICHAFCELALPSGLFVQLALILRICVATSAIQLSCIKISQTAPLRSISSGSTIHGNSGHLFSECWNWEIWHTHQAFKIPLRTFRGKLRTFPTVRSITIGFLLDRTQQYTSQKLLVSHFRKKSC